MNTKKWMWWILHLPILVHNREDIVTIAGAWNSEYPEYIYPRHFCHKCDREVSNGKIHMLKPAPECPRIMGL